MKMTIDYLIDEMSHLEDWQKVIIKDLVKQPKVISTRPRKRGHLP